MSGYLGQDSCWKWLIERYNVRHNLVTFSDRKGALWFPYCLPPRQTAFFKGRYRHIFLLAVCILVLVTELTTESEELERRMVPSPETTAPTPATFMVKRKHTTCL